MADDNAYFLHKENVLVAMLTDKDVNARQAAFESIMQARQSYPSGNGIRVFEKPTINYEASHYTDIVSPDGDDGIEPPITKKLSEPQLKLCVESHNNVISQMLAKIPCHTQSVERLIRVVSSTSQKVSGVDSRNKAIIAKLRCRKMLENTDSKKDFIDFMKS